MKMPLPQPLRLPAAGLMIALLLGSLAIAFSLKLRGEAYAVRQTAELALHAAQQQLQQIPAAIELVQGSQALYQDLAKRGFIGEERRLLWISDLARLRDELPLDHLAWRLEPRLQDPYVSGLSSSTLHIRAVPMEAGALDTMLRRLADYAHGRFSVRRCSLRLNEPQPAAECELVWWTWRDE